MGLGAPDDNPVFPFFDYSEEEIRVFLPVRRQGPVAFGSVIAPSQVRSFSCT